MMRYKFSQTLTRNMVRIIAFHGRKRSGKNSGAKAFPDAKELAFADALKLAAMHLFNLTYEQVYDDKLKEVVDERWGMTPRQILQLLGTEGIRALFGGDHFVKLMKTRVDQAIKEGHHMVIMTDVRFEEEAQFILSQGGEVIEVIRPSLESTDQHASEQPLPRELISTTIVNDGTIEELQQKVLSFVNRI
jgi:hypothetical protein